MALTGSSLSACRSRALIGAVAALILVPLMASAQPAPDASAQTPAAQAQSQPPQSAESVVSGGAASVLGQKVVGPKGESLGLIVDVLVDPSGRPQAAIVDFGGFLGVGSRKIAIDWNILDFSHLGHGGTVELGLGRAQIAAAPEYKPGSSGPAVMTTPPAPDATQKNP
jgi:hypothetical protein